MSDFESALAIILREEGGFVNNPHDPGGMTNLGVTQRVWEDWSGAKASEADMRGLTPAKVGPLYRAQYWNAVQGDTLPPALAICVFDFAVNSGVGRAGRYLQQMVGAVVDGHIGPGTVKALGRFISDHGVSGSVQLYQNERRAFYRSLATFATFGKGWLRRCDDVETLALRSAP